MNFSSNLVTEVVYMLVLLILKRNSYYSYLIRSWLSESVCAKYFTIKAQDRERVPQVGRKSDQAIYIVYLHNLL